MFRSLLSHGSKDRSMYQELPAVDHHDHHDSDKLLPPSRKEAELTEKPRLQFRKTKLFVKCLAATAVVAAGVQLILPLHHPFRISQDSSNPPTPHHGTLPTLLSVLAVNASGVVKESPTSPPLYVYSLDNPLYDRLRQAKWSDERSSKKVDSGITDWPQLSVDRTKVVFYEPLVVSWSTGSRVEPDAAVGVRRNSKVNPHLHANRYIVTNETILVLLCHDDEEEVDKDGSSVLDMMMDAATVQQASETSRHHLRQADAITLQQLHLQSNHEGTWFIPRFPAIRHSICYFRMYQPLQSPDDRESMMLLAESPRLMIQSLHTPLSIHLALTSDPSQMVVNFVTETGSNCRNVPVVEYGPVATKFQRQRRQGTTDSYSANDMCQAPANQTEAGKFSPPGCLHSVTMNQLEPNTRYSYQVGVEGGQGILEWSPVYEFTSAPEATASSSSSSRAQEPNDEFQPFAFLAYGDQGCPATGWTIGGEWIARMVETELDHNVTADRPMVRMVHHIGDLSYAEGAAHLWDEWQHMIEPITRRVPYMVGVGNHEYDHLEGGLNKDPSGVKTDAGFHPVWGNMGNDSGGECGVPTAKRFTMPQSDTSNGVFWYSYDFSKLHTIMLSSEHDLQRGSPQHTWLEHDLQSVDRSKTPWVIVETHRPLYNPETLWEQNAVGINMRYEIEDLLRQFNVDLVLAGHYHSYFRSCAGLYRDQCHKGGPTHLTIGSAGARLDEAWLYPNQWTAKSIQHQYGYSRITFYNASALHFEFVKVGDVNDTTSGQVGDEFWLRKDSR